MQSTFAFGDRFGGQGECVCVCVPLTVCVGQLLYMCVILIHIIHILQGSGQSFITVCVHLSDRSVPEATAAAKYHTPGCTACAAPSHSVSSKTLLPC